MVIEVDHRLVVIRAGAGASPQAVVEPFDTSVEVDERTQLETVPASFVAAVLDDQNFMRTLSASESWSRTLWSAPKAGLEAWSYRTSGRNSIQL